jgi:hypothetical protein
MAHTKGTECLTLRPLKAFIANLTKRVALSLSHEEQFWIELFSEGNSSEVPTACTVRAMRQFEACPHLNCALEHSEHSSHSVVVSCRQFAQWGTLSAVGTQELFPLENNSNRGVVVLWREQFHQSPYCTHQAYVTWGLHSEHSSHCSEVVSTVQIGTLGAVEQWNCSLWRTTLLGIEPRASEVTAPLWQPMFSWSVNTDPNALGLRNPCSYSSNKQQ